MKKILIIGGNGYIGSRLSVELAKSGHKVTPVCFPGQPKDRQWSSLMDEVIVGSIADLALVEQLVAKDYDTVINLVSLDHHASNDASNLVAKVNVMPTWNFLSKAAERGVLKKFIYFSTVQVYGRVPAGTTITEEHPVAPVNTYGLTHYLCEDICNYYNRVSKINCINVRLSNSYAAPVFPDANCWWLVINDLCKQAVEDGEITLLSDGSPQRDFIHHQDLAQAVKLLIDGDVTSFNTFNLCSGQTYTIMEIACCICDVYFQMTGHKLPIFTPAGQYESSKSCNSAVERVVFDNSRLRKNYNFASAVDIESGIEELITMLR